MVKEVIAACEGFEWDEGNTDKNWYLHQVTDGECEEVFFNLPLLAAFDKKHSQHEPSYYVLGRTEADRWLFIAFAIRNKRIRVISARDMTDREARKYAERVKTDTDLQE